MDKDRRMCIVLKLHHCTFILANDVMLSIGQYSIQRWCSYIVCLHTCAPHSNAVTCNVTATIPYFLCTGCHDVCIVHTSVHAHVATRNSWQGSSLNWHRSLSRLCKRFGGEGRSEGVELSVSWCLSHATGDIPFYMCRDFTIPSGCATHIGESIVWNQHYRAVNSEEINYWKLVE